MPVARLLHKKVLLVGGLTFLLGLVSYFPVDRHIAAARLLTAMQKEDRTVPPVVGSQVDDLVSSDGQPIAAFVYGPSAEDARLSIVLGHGIHHMGIHEPRLIRFARHLADRGVRVLTPELAELADYRVTESGVQVLRSCVAHLARDGERVGLIGFSFAGGLALLAAEEETTAARLLYVASVGGYHDLSRTLRFLATDQVETPSGTVGRNAHEYGLLVLIYGHLEQLGFGADTPVLSRLLSAWLKEDRATARSLVKRLETERARHLVDLLENGKLTELSAEVLPLLEARTRELERLSPRGRLGKIPVPLLFLHGSGDTVVPPEETAWAALELEKTGPSGSMALVTPLLEHVRVDHEAGLREKWKLVHLVAQFF